MGKMLAALMQLQSVERDLTQVRRRLQSRKNAVAIQQKRIEQAQATYNALHDKTLSRRKDADRIELDLKTREAQVERYRGALNLAKTNKEYAGILTQINTIKADNAKVEEEILKIMQEVDAIKAQAQQADAQLKAEQARLAEVEKASGSEIARLSKMIDDLQARREAAAKEVPPESLAVFERLSESYEGEAMAIVEVRGKRPPLDYVCGGCFMSLNAEHANVLRQRDEIRTCDNCKRILYMEPAAQGAAKE